MITRAVLIAFLALPALAQGGPCGKLVDFTAAYLQVWKAEGGSCKLAAQMFEPEGEK
jgi:hypothetical protein